jgi:uncharacterized membrane protein YgcG
MAYQVYFAELAEENKALMLTILKLKEESDALEPGEAELLYTLRGSSTPTPLPPEAQPSRQRTGGGAGGGANRRGSGRRGGQRSSSNNGGGSSNGGGGNSGGGTGGSNN